MGDIYVVMLVSLTSWVGIFYLLWRLDRRLDRLEKQGK